MQYPQFQLHAELEENHWWFTGRRHIVQILLEELHIPSQEIVVVDVGCGTGGNTAFFAPKYRCIGIDPSSDAIAFARQRYPHVSFVCGYAPQDIREELSQADVVLLLDVLEHVESDREFVSSLLGSMKPGAHLVLMAPADASLMSPHDAGFEHFRRYRDLTHLRGLWEGEAVRERLVGYCNSRLYPVIKFLRWISHYTGRAWGPANTDLSLPPRLLNTLLHWIFAGEVAVLLQHLRGRDNGYRRGVSVIALLQKKAGSG